MTKLNVLPSAGDALDGVQIQSPCHVPWDSLLGDDRVRHCMACRQKVYNIEALSRREALDLITSNEGRLCLRILRRPDGTVVTSDCVSRLRAARRRGLWALACALVVVGWAQLTAMATGLYGLNWLMQRPVAPARAVLGGAPLPNRSRGLMEVERVEPVAVSEPALMGAPVIMGKRLPVVKRGRAR